MVAVIVEGGGVGDSAVTSSAASVPVNSCASPFLTRNLNAEQDAKLVVTGSTRTFARLSS